MMGRHISSLYFDYRPAGWHLAGCAAAVSNRWEVTEYTWQPSYIPKSEHTIRLFCPECGAAMFFSWQENDEADKPTVEREQTRAEHIGYGSKPERVAGLFLHAGPPLLCGQGPDAYYLTRTKDRPRARGDVAGMVGQKRGRRGGIRWVAGIGCGELGGIERAADGDFASKAAAVKWVAGELAAADWLPDSDDSHGWVSGPSVPVAGALVILGNPPD